MSALHEPLAWWDQAACAGTNPIMWFPDNGAPSPDALTICQSCPVKAECLQDALETRDEFGIRGGLYPRARRALLTTTQARGTCRYCSQPLPVGVHATTRLHKECALPWKNVRRRRAERRNP